MMKLKKYQKGGSMTGPVKPKKKTMIGPPKPPGYKEPTAEEKREAEFTRKRNALDKELERMRKQGATEEQIEKYASKMISSFSKGGKVVAMKKK